MKSILILLLSGFLVNSQEISIDKNEFNIEILHARKLGKIQIATNVILKSKILKTISLKIRATSKNGEKELLDINKFSLVDEENRTRSRPINVSVQSFTKYFSLTKLVQAPLKKKNFHLRYDPTIIDSFKDFDFNGYALIEIPVDYDGWGKQEKQVVYFKPEAFKSKRVNFFFPFLTEGKKGNLYYGKKKIAELDFK